MGLAAFLLPPKERNKITQNKTRQIIRYAVRYLYQAVGRPSNKLEDYMKTLENISADTTLAQITLPSGNVLFSITTEVEKDWAGKKNSVTTQRTLERNRNVCFTDAEIAAAKETAISQHNYAMDNLGINSYDHQH